MRAGKLDKIITIEVRARVQASDGEMVDGWTPHAGGPVWAELIQGKAMERVIGAQLVATTEAVFRLRWSPHLLDLFPDTHRLTYARPGGAVVVYAVGGAVEIPRRQGVAVYCTGRAENPVSDLPPGGD